MSSYFKKGFDSYIKEALGGEALGRHLETAGLGLLMAPVAHDLIRKGDEPERPGLRKIKAGAELAGLGLLLPKAHDIAKKVFKAKA